MVTLTWTVGFAGEILKAFWLNELVNPSPLVPGGLGAIEEESATESLKPFTSVIFSATIASALSPTLTEEVLRVRLRLGYELV